MYGFPRKLKKQSLMQKSPEKMQSKENENNAIPKKYFSGIDRHGISGRDKGEKDKE